MGCIFKKLIPGVLLGCWLLAGGRLSAQAVDGVAAVVNDSVITFSEVRKEVEPTEMQYRQMYTGMELVEKVKEARLGTLKALIERQLIIQDFEAQGFFLPENVVDDQMNKVIKEKFGGDRNTFIRTLQAQGVSIDAYKQNLKNSIIVQAMRQRNVSSAIIVSPYQIEQYYQENIRQFVQPTQAKIRDIFMRKALFMEDQKDAQGNTVQVDPALQQMKEILAKVESGEDFSELAKTYSQGTQSSNGGDLGWVTATSLRKELADVAFSLRPGQNSKIIETDDGYHILLVDDIKQSSVIPLSQVRDGIEGALLQQEKERLQQQWLDSLRSKAFIKMFF